MQTNMLRSFIAVGIPTEIQEAITHSTTQLQKELPKPLVHWVPSHNIHLTLKFLGDVSAANLEQLTAVLKVEAASHEAFSLFVSGLGAYPTSRRARVIWVGLKAPSNLAALHRGVEMAAARLGYAPEERPFSPHLTIGRVDQHATAADLQKIRTSIESLKIGDLGITLVDALHIYKSDLKPTGPVYSSLYALPLKS
jgi:2'-5' RNA ligase